MTAANHLKDIFDADRAMQRAEKALLEQPADLLSDLLAAAVTEAKAFIQRDEKEATMRLQRLADLCAQIPRRQMAQTLIEILDSDVPRIRVSAAEALVDVAFDRYGDVTQAVDQVLQRHHDGPAMGELPWVVAEIAEPSAPQLIGRFLALDNPSIVASAAEALATLGARAAVPLLEPLRDDKRIVDLDQEDDGEAVSATLGDIVTELIYSLSCEEDPDQEYDSDGVKQDA